MNNSVRSHSVRSLKEKKTGTDGKFEHFPVLRSFPRNWEQTGTNGNGRERTTFFGVDSQAAALVSAIHRCCDFRGDDDTNRAALVDESASCPAHLMADLIGHFHTEGERWRVATGQPPQVEKEDCE